MHLKLILSLALVGVCTCRSLLGYDKFYVEVGYDNIYIRNIQNQDVKIFTTKQETPCIQLYITGPEGYTKTLNLNDIQVGYGGQYQSDILYQIFKQYEGELDQNIYLRLLKTVEKYVELNEVNPIILYALRTLFYQDQETFALLDQEYKTYQPQSKYYGPYNNLYGKYYGFYKNLFGGYYQPQKYSGYYGLYKGYNSPYTYQFDRDIFSGYETPYKYGYQYDKYYGPYNKAYGFFNRYGGLKGLYDNTFEGYNKPYEYSFRGLYEPFKNVDSGYYGPYAGQSYQRYYGQSSPSYFGRTLYGRQYGQSGFDSFDTQNYLGRYLGQTAY